MSFNKTAYEKAERELVRRKDTAETAQTTRFNEVAARSPELLQIDKIMKSHILNLTKLMFQKGDDLSVKLEKIKAEHKHGSEIKQRILTENGYPDDYLNIKYCCEKCSDSGFIDGLRCECFLRLINKYAAEELNRSANLPDCDFEHFSTSFYSGKTETGLSINTIMENNYKAALKYADEFSENSDSLLIYGKTGLGKTHISLAIAKRVIERGYSAAYNSIINLLGEINREKFQRADDPTADTERDVINVDLLVIDDLGSEHNTPYTESILYNIINTRMNLKKPTIINCNLDDFEDLRDRYNDRIISRIAAFYKRMRFVGNDIRQIKRKLKE
ncbi:MAG: ATP-binding protein [Ruminococcus sp.]|jgi:DNA replication protein DnaC|nr:ATP-binding protein [Ruminococcus sp.]